MVSFNRFLCPLYFLLIKNRSRGVIRFRFSGKTCFHQETCLVSLDVAAIEGQYLDPLIHQRLQNGNILILLFLLYIIPNDELVYSHPPKVIRG